MYCKAGVACTNPEVYGDIKRGRRLAPSKGIVCPRCQGKCCNEACLEKHKCKQRARPSSSVGGMRVAQHARWQGLEAGAFDPTGGLLDPNMAMALARAGQGGLLLPQGAQQYPQGFMLGTGEGGNMMPVIPILPFPLMFNAAALQQAGAEGGGLGAAELQAALAAAGVMQASGGAGGLSAPMMLAPMGNPGTEDAAAAASVSQALQLAQLQQLQAAGLGAGPLLQLTVQPDGSTGLVQAGSNQRLAMPQGLMQGMPLQLPGGLQFLSAEQLQMAADGSGSMPLMQVMADGTAGAMDQATVDAVAAAAAAGGLGGGLMAGLTAMGANLNALAGVSGSEAQALLEQQQQLELNAAAAAAVAAAAEGLPPGMAEGVDQAVANEAVAAAAAAAAAAAGAEAGMQAVAYGGEGDPNAHAAALAASAPEGADAAQQQAAAAAAAAAHEHGDAPVSADGVPASGVHTLAGADPTGLMLPAIPPLQMAPALAAALTATNGGRGLYNAEEDTAAAALMSLATDKKNKAAAAAAAAHAAAMAAESGIIPQAMAAQALEEARLLQAEAEAEAEAEAAKAAAGQLEQQQQPQQDQLQAHQPDPTAAGAAGDDAVKQEYGMSAEEQLQQLHMQLLQQQQLQQLMQQQAQHEAEQQQVQLKYEQEQHHLAAQQQAIQSEGMEHQVNQQQQ